MKIAFFHNLHSGGAWRVANEQACRLAEQGVEIDLFEPTTAKPLEVPASVRVHRLAFRPLPTLRRPLGRLNYAARSLDLGRLRRFHRQVAAQIEAGGYDLLFVHPSQFVQGPPLLRYVRKLPTLYYCHEPLRRLYEPPLTVRPTQRGERWSDRIDPLRRGYLRRLGEEDRTATQAATHVVVNSRYTQGEVERIYGVASEVCPPGIDVETFRPLGLSRNGSLLSVGALTPYKRFDTLIEALGRADVSVSASPTGCTETLPYSHVSPTSGVAKASTGMRPSVWSRCAARHAAEDHACGSSMAAGTASSARPPRLNTLASLSKCGIPSAASALSGGA